MWNWMSVDAREDYISKLGTSFVLLILNDTAKAKLAFLYYEEFVKNSSAQLHNCTYHDHKNLYKKSNSVLEKYMRIFPKYRYIL